MDPQIDAQKRLLFLNIKLDFRVIVGIGLQNGEQIGDVARDAIAQSIERHRRTVLQRNQIGRVLQSLQNRLILNAQKMDFIRKVSG